MLTKNKIDWWNMALNFCYRGKNLQNHLIIKFITISTEFTTIVWFTLIFCHYLQNMRVYIGILMTVFNYISLNDHSMNVLVCLLYCTSRHIKKYHYYMKYKFNNWCSVSTAHQIIWREFSFSEIKIVNSSFQ